MAVKQKTHRLCGSGAGQGRVDHPVLQDWAGRGLPANIQSVGGGIEDLDVLDGAALHCRRNRGGGGQRGVEGRKQKFRWGSGWGGGKRKCQEKSERPKKLSRGERWGR